MKQKAFSRENTNKEKIDTSFRNRHRRNLETTSPDPAKHISNILDGVVELKKYFEQREIENKHFH
ncbi:MAG: hypothetical protein JNN15_20785 [Blastocatellia bacterium]|nr:hypothetical protein [Blastocatellia bacterium]